MNIKLSPVQTVDKPPLNILNLYYINLSYLIDWQID